MTIQDYFHLPTPRPDAVIRFGCPSTVVLAFQIRRLSKRGGSFTIQAQEIKGLRCKLTCDPDYPVELGRLELLGGSTPMVVPGSKLLEQARDLVRHHAGETSAGSAEG